MIFFRGRGSGVVALREEREIESQCSAKERESRKAAVRFTFKMSSHFSSGNSVPGERCWMPPLWTRMSTSCLSWTQTRETIESISGGEERSQVYAWH